ncbi:MAG: MmgE/PrpD family protein, partial [Chloroflexota bacterium]
MELRNIIRHTATETLARYVVATNYEDIPTEVLRLAKRQVLDTIGVGLAGSRQPHGAIMRRTVRSWGGRRQATVWASNLRCPAPSAALANGTFCHALDYDDTWQTLSVHPSGVLVPAVTAAGETHHASGRQFLTSLIVGYEVAGKLGMAVRQGYPRHWHPTPVIGTMAATAAAAKLIGLQAQQLQMALGLAASMAGGLAAQGGTMTKPLHSGLAARNGVIAAHLAAEGFTANNSVLDDRRGYYEAFFGDSLDLEKALECLGQPYHLLSPGIGVKMYPSGWRLHHSFEATLAIVVQYDIKPEQVKGVEIGVPHEHYFNRGEILWGLAGKFSLQYHVAMAILDRRLTIDSFTDERALAPDAQALLHHIVVQVDPSIPEAA